MNFIIGCLFVWMLFDCARWVNKVTAKVDAPPPPVTPPPIPAVRVIYQTSMEDTIQMERDFHRIAELNKKLEKCQADLEMCGTELMGCRCGSFRSSTPSIQTLPRDVEDYNGELITAEEIENTTWSRP
jgi:hypothetical protein